jgi:hypothetical protein
VRHQASPRFWQAYNALPPEAQRLADENYELLKRDPRHPSLHFKKVGRFWSARIGAHHRALAIKEGGDVVWFWIGRHDEYDRLIGPRR